ncbi:putative aminoglycoside phosphotransferase [Polymorphobacter glacialis]|uniref:Aminoglycoside phosphotransferase n=1 Tax=Sandarakinorhabdus glacialis TaxID=1614636 RepID=A0A917E6C0_9SPHN|nr:aminoglycoside phosphotransferase family protein [Polymorphobacter glacialis]GGE03712.1 putative aminoglycoside phosphotransferase [Polymorphobacter glacialis]
MIDAAILGGLRAAGLVGEAPVVTALAGGVSCDVWRVETGSRMIVVKRALPKLRVAADWFAPVDRVASEVRWLRRARGIEARLVPEVLVELPELHSFAMAFVEDAPVWKDELVAGRVNVEFAAAVGRELVRIHAATAGNVADAAAFQTGAMFEALRIAPFLRYVAERDAGVAEALGAIADRLAGARIALVHGDVSPKNILVTAEGPVFLDAECAVFGDPAFDLAFCTAHLLLKAVWKRDDRYRAAAGALVAAYAAKVGWEPVSGLMERAGALTAAILLARVDGKSPAPYLTEAGDREVVRFRARDLINAPRSLGGMVADWRAEA